MTIPYGQISAADDSDFDAIRVNWFNGLTGANLQYSTDDEGLLNIISNIDSEAAQYLQTFNRTGDGYLWPDLDSAEISGYITQSYTRLQAMALAYNTVGSSYYHDESLKNDILYGLDWLYNNRYNENVTERYDNWYDWEIGSPLRLKDILVLMYDSLTPELLEKYTNTISFFCPSVT